MSACVKLLPIYLPMMPWLIPCLAFYEGWCHKHGLSDVKLVSVCFGLLLHVYSLFFWRNFHTGLHNVHIDCYFTYRVCLHFPCPQEKLSYLLSLFLAILTSWSWHIIVDLVDIPMLIDYVYHLLRKVNLCHNVFLIVCLRISFYIIIYE